MSDSKRSIYVSMYLCMYLTYVYIHNGVVTCEYSAKLLPQMPETGTIAPIQLHTHPYNIYLHTYMNIQICMCT